MGIQRTHHGETGRIPHNGVREEGRYHDSGEIHFAGESYKGCTVKRRARTGKTLNGWLVAAVLVLCCVSGLATGVLARTLSGRAAAQGPGSTMTSGGSPAATHVATMTPSPILTPTVTSATVQATGFTLTVATSPAQVTPGQAFTVTVTVLSAAKAPLAGVECYMRAPSDGSPSLFQDMPTPQISNADGQAIWNLQAPSASPGTYRIEVVAYGSAKYFFFSYAHLTLAAS